MGTQINEARRTLNDHRQRLLGRIRSSDATERNQQETREDRSDQIDADELSQVVEHLSSRERQELTEVDEALSRIARGVYGKCEACGKAIGRERLRALPTASRCLPCSAVADAA